MQGSYARGLEQHAKQYTAVRVYKTLPSDAQRLCDAAGVLGTDVDTPKYDYESVCLLYGVQASYCGHAPLPQEPFCTRKLVA